MCLSDREPRGRAIIYKYWVAVGMVSDGFYPFFLDMG
jgi:hypothetical protein